jgi:hypothetical protein
MTRHNQLTCYRNAPMAAHHRLHVPASPSAHKMILGTLEKQSQPVVCDHEAALPSFHAQHLEHKGSAEKCYVLKQ